MKQRKRKMTEAGFRALCAKYGTPDDVPCDELPVKVAAALSGAPRFFDTPDSVDAAVEELKQYGLLR
jgi:hypothetical protein